MVATDRISAFDVILPKGIPHKGQVLNQIAAKFLDLTADICPNWKLATPDPMVTVGLKCEGFRVEMIIRSILTGSAHSVNERQSWSEALRPWLQEAVARELPVFATCYGHQLLADALGGIVGANPNGMEIGNITLNRLPACDDDPLFAPLPATFSANAWHSESVLQLPPGAVPLVANAHDPHHAYRLGKNAWGVQFHPEFAQEAMRDIIAQNRAHIADADALIAAVPAAQPHATALLQRFAQLALGV